MGFLLQLLQLLQKRIFGGCFECAITHGRPLPRRGDSTKESLKSMVFDLWG